MTRPALRALIAPAVATAVALAVLLGLGVWQLERRIWKEALLDRIATRSRGEAVAIIPEGAWPSWQAADDEFRRVRLQGRFLADKTVAVHGLAEVRPGEALQGSYVFTPLRLAGGGLVEVNRGIVPTDRLSATLARLRAEDGGETTVTGLVRAPQTRTAFVPANDLARDDWYVRDLDDMARSRGLARLAPFYVDAERGPDPAAWPRGGQTEVALRNAHLQYAITWFALAAVLLAVFARFAALRLSPRAAEAAPSPPRTDGAEGGAGAFPPAPLRAR